MKMTRGRRILLALALSIGLPAACVTTPRGNTTVAPGTRSLVFAGVYPYSKDRRVTVQIQVQRGASWDPLGPPLVVRDDSRWTVDEGLIVPDEYWVGPCEVAVFRAISSEGSAALLGQDSACLDAAGPSVTLEEALGCLTDQLVVARGASDVRYTPPDELRITSQREADRYRCISVLDGNLSLVGESRVGATPPYYARGVTLSLPNLTEVTGRLAIDGGRAERILLPLLRTVGAKGRAETGLSVTLNLFKIGATEFLATHFDAPRLTRVEGTLEAQNAQLDDLAAHPDTRLPDFGLASITYAEHVRIRQLLVNQAILAGFSGLTRVGRDVTIQYDHWEMDYPVLLPNLADIGGSLTLMPASYIRHFLPALRHVGENFSIVERSGYGCSVGVSATVADSAFAGLESIGGDLSIRGCLMSRCDAFPGLTTVGGALRLSEGFNDRGRVEFGATGTSVLSLGGLDIQATLVHGIPFHDDAILSAAGSATVTIRGNSNLCQCQADAYLQTLRTRGFTGTGIATENAACPKPCPPAPTCP